MQARSFYVRCLSMQTARGIQLETIFSFNNPRLSCFCLVKVKWDADSMGWRWRDTRETCREFICHYKHISQFCKFLKLFGIGIKRKSLFVNHWCFPGPDDIFSLAYCESYRCLLFSRLLLLEVLISLSSALCCHHCAIRPTWPANKCNIID